MASTSLLENSSDYQTTPDHRKLFCEPHFVSGSGQLCKLTLTELISAIAAIAAQIVITAQRARTNDYTLNLWALSLCSQFVQCCIITTSCVPYLKPFFHSLQSGALGNEEVVRQTIHEQYDYDINHRDRKAENSKDSKTTASNSTKSHPMIYLQNLRSKLNGPSNEVNISAVGREDDAKSQTSQSRMITETRTWDVDVETLERDH
jgi:hypothetical protein